jgi:UDP-GlcNAc:undecaprenyl-phosphate GlcNAc-1-phosphate transferase
VREAAIAFVASLTLAGVLIKFSPKLGLLDSPGPIKPHARPIPYTGGAGIMIVLLVVGELASVPWQALAGVGLAWLIGFVDDWRRLAPRLKLFLEVPVLLIGSFAIELGGTERIAAVVAGVVLINAFNVIDGLDGLAGGTAVISLVSASFIFPPLAALAQIAIGAVLAFLVFNLPPAKLFMGDEGSLVLGYLLWLIPLAALAVAPSPGLFVATALVWAFPLVNAVFVILIRLRSGRSVLAGDRSHLYDALYRRVGLRGTLLVCWGVAAVGVLAAAAIA